MRALVIYESMFGNTHLVAEAIGKGLAPGNDVTVVPVATADRDLVARAELLVVGGPTHIHGMSQARSRQGAVAMAHKDGSGLTVEGGADGPGLREWFGALGTVSARAAAFDTRIAGPAVFTGRASKGIAKLLARHGMVAIAPAESFLVTSDNVLRPGEEDRAEAWGRKLAAATRGAAHP
jgi:hypothetical protein